MIFNILIIFKIFLVVWTIGWNGFGHERHSIIRNKPMSYIYTVSYSESKEKTKTNR
jgi:hypothetical protein